MRIVGLWRYPVASFAGERRPDLVLRQRGPAGDRTYVAVRAADGTVAAPERSPAWWPAPFVEAVAGPLYRIRVPGGKWHAVGSAAAGRALADHFGFAVHLRKACPFNRPDPTGGGVCVRAPRQPLHVLTTWELDRLKRALGGTAFAVARFRPNVLLEATESETERLRRGPATLVGPEGSIEIMEETVRCGVPVLAMPNLPRDARILKHLQKAHRLRFGFGGRIDGPGILREGDVLLCCQPSSRRTDHDPGSGSVR